MTIERNDNENLVKVCDLKVGDCFLGDEKHLYLIIKLESPFSANVFSKPYNIPVVDLNSNSVTTYRNDVFVTKICAKIVTNDI